MSAAAELRDGLRAFGIARPARLARVLATAVREGKSLGAGVLAAARVWPQVRLFDDGGSCTLARVGELARTGASILEQDFGAQPGSRIGVLCGNDRYFLGAIGAASLTGAVVVPIWTAIGSERLGAVAARERLDVLLYDPEYSATINESGYLGGLLDVSRLDSPRPAPQIRSLAKRSRFTMLSSGTTGTPKGIPIRRRYREALAALALAGISRIEVGSPVAVAVPISHGYGLAAAMLCLVNGSPLVLCQGADPAKLAARLRQTGTRTLFASPPQLRRLAECLDELPPLASVVSGSDALDAETIAAFGAHFGPVLVNYYGTTETGTVCSLGGGELLAHPDSVGRPIATARVVVVDAGGRPVPEGVEGLVRIESATMSVTDPGKRWLTTRDRAYLRDGLLHVLGRADNLTRSGGEFTDPAQVQAVLASAPGVRRAMVWEEPDADFGKRLHASVEGADLDAEALRSLVRQRLGPAAVPKQVTVMPT
ncbi:MAG: AMP-binding protein [Propionibacteriaceae bacterium]|jgi:acyl-CoA synthetase (AMP-forming)/AMP-acid ligase II|nr:AMP-binding protein [Propionibacteriaceae bacterium]